MNENPRKFESRSNFSQGFFWGTILAAAGIFLFATKRGKKIREYLKEHGQEILEELEDIYNQIQEKEFGKKKSDAAQALDKQHSNKQKDLSHIKKLQERGRGAVRFFKRNGKALK